MNNLTSQDINIYLKNHGHLILVSPANTTCQIYGFWYDGQSFRVRQGYPNDFLTIDTTHPDTEVLLEDDAIHIRTTNNDEWIIKEMDFEYLISNEFCEEEMFEDYQVRLCDKRAEELSLYLNQRLDMYDDFGLFVVVSLRGNVEYNCSTPEYPNSFDVIVTHNFEIFITNGDGDVYAGGYILCLDISNDAALEVLTRELIRQLLPIQERYKDGF